MKRILSLFIILVLVLGTLAACQPKEATSNEADIQQAYKQVEDMYKKYNGTAIPNGEELIAQVKIEKTVFTITWTSSNENVKVELNDGLYVVTLPKDITEQSEYTLTATIKSEGGQEAKYEIKTVLTASYGMITNPEAGKAYKLALLHGNEGPGVVYFDGDIYKPAQPFYLHYSKDASAAVDVYLEAVEGVEGGFRLYFEKDGVKTYISGCPRSDKPTQGSLELITTTPTSYWKYSTEHNTLICDSVEGVTTEFYMGSSGTYTSISASSISYITNPTSYPCRLYGVGGVEEKLPEQNLPELPENPTVSDILNAAEQLLVGQKLEVNFEITGVITSFKYAFDASYNNVSPIIEVNGKKITCFRISGTGMDTIKVGDTITVFVTGVNRQSKTEISTLEGGLIKSVVPGTGEQPGGTTTPTTPAEILNALYGLADGETLTGSYTLTGKITELDSYNNPTIVVEGFEDKPVYCYKLVVDKAVGDVITVTATTLKNFGGTYELMNCTLVENGDNQGGNTTESKVPVVVDAPVVGTAYKFALVHGGLNNAIHYITGAMDGYYFGSTTDVNSAADVYLETADGGYYIYIKTGDSNSYLSIEYALGTDNAYHYNVKFTDAPLNVYTYDATLKTFVTTVEGKVYALGTASNKTYKTISAVDTTKGSYFCQFYTLESHVCNEADYSAPTCTTPATCPVCGTTKGESLGHTDGDKDHKCDVADCGATVGTHNDGETVDGMCDYCGKAAAATTTEKLSVYASTGVLASDNLSISWTATNFTLTNYKGGSNTAIRTTDTNHFRVYQNSYVEITANNGKKVSQVVITINPYSDKTQSYIDAVTGYVKSDIPGATATVDGYKITITLGTPVETLKIGATAQWRLNTIEVTVQ